MEKYHTLETHKYQRDVTNELLLSQHLKRNNYDFCKEKCNDNVTKKALKFISYIKKNILWSWPNLVYRETKQ